MDSLKQGEIWSLAGRILHYAPLVPTSRFNIVHIVRANSYSTNKQALVPVSPDLKRQLHFWWILLRTTDGLASIPYPLTSPPAWALNFYTDAAGGFTLSIGHGTGGLSQGFWFFVPWGRKINSGIRGADGKQLSRKLSALELVGPLICLAAGFDRCRGRPIVIWVDNAGSVAIWRKGYSFSCPLSTTLVAAIGRLAAAAGSTVYIQKITRCSGTGSTLADLLSKGKVQRFRDSLPADWLLPTDPAWIPPSILQWISDPVARPDLGDRILNDLSPRVKLLSQ